MPAPSTTDEFLDLVRKSGVVEEKRLATQLARLRASGQMPTAPLELARLFVGEGVLTRFQAEQFLQGKWRRFTLGKYKVLEKLGSGGMGSVYLCEHTLMRRRVAVKVLPNKKDSADTSARDRFYREARAVAALDHPNIVRAYDIDEEDDLHFLVMEHVDGASLQEIVKRYPNGIDALRACHYIRQSALGLQHAHEKASIVHRDIKPANILVDRNGIVKVLDMGLARFFHDEEDLLTKEYDEKVLGTADYLAPEQALDSHTVDIRADIYSLGATFYFCLTGKPPFAEGSVAQKLIWHQTRTPRPARTIRPDIPEAVAAILERMMAKDRAARYQTPQEVADALAPLTQTPIPPPPESEMPQLSLAATRVLNPGGDASLAGPRSSESGSKRWNVSVQTPSPSDAPVVVAPQAATPAPPSLPPPPPRPASVPASPTPAQATPAPQPAPPKPPQPQRPLAPAPVEQHVAHAPVAPQPALVPTVPSLELPPSRPAPVPAAPAPLLPPSPAPGHGAPELTTEPLLAPEEEPFVPPFEPGATVKPRRQRGPQQGEAPSGAGLWVGAGIAATLVLVAAAVGVWLFFSGTEKKPPGPTERKPIHVTRKTSGGLAGALKSAEDGDRIVIDVDTIEEAGLVVRTKKLTIEAASGKTVTWKPPVKIDPRDKLLTIDNRANVTLRNIHFDGLGKLDTLVVVYGACEGLKMENVRLQGARRYALLFANAAGTSDEPIVLENVAAIKAPGSLAAVRFRIFEHHKTIHQNDHITFRACKIEGPPPTVTRERDTEVGENVTLPEGLNFANVPEPTTPK